MSDAAFKTAAFPGYTTAQLRAFIDKEHAFETHMEDDKYYAMCAELERRERVAGGDVSVMTDGERLRFYREGGKI